MEHEQERILELAAEIAKLIEGHPVTVEYRSMLEVMRRDADSLDLLEKLVALGRNLNEMAKGGREIEIVATDENRRIEERLRENSMVKAFIGAQKSYFNLVNQVIGRINHPKERA